MGVTRTDVSQTIIPQITIGGLTIRNVVVDTGPMDFEMTTDVRAVALLGFDFINGAVIHVDYEHKKVEAIRDAAFHPETIPDVFAVPAALDDGVPLVPVKVGDTVSRRFIVDTGSDIVMIFSGFARSHPADVRDQGRGVFLQHTLLSIAEVIGGTLRMEPTELKTVTFGRSVFADFLTERTVDAGNFEGDDFDGLIGTEFLRFYDLYFDYARGRIVMAPNATYRNSVSR